MLYEFEHERMLEDHGDGDPMLTPTVRNIFGTSCAIRRSFVVVGAAVFCFQSGAREAGSHVWKLLNGSTHQSIRFFLASLYLGGLDRTDVCFRQV